MTDTAPRLQIQQRGARLVLAGVIAGAASGLFGVGGGIVIVPALVSLCRFDRRVAHGTSLAAILPTSLAGSAAYGAGGEVAWRQQCHSQWGRSSAR